MGSCWGAPAGIMEQVVDPTPAVDSTTFHQWPIPHQVVFSLIYFNDCLGFCAGCNRIWLDCAVGASKTSAGSSSSSNSSASGSETSRASSSNIFRVNGTPRAAEASSGVIPNKGLRPAGGGGGSERHDGSVTGVVSRSRSPPVVTIAPTLSLAGLHYQDSRKVFHRFFLFFYSYAT